MPPDCVPPLASVGRSIFEQIGDGFAFCRRAPKPATEPLPSSQRVEFGLNVAMDFSVIIACGPWLLDAPSYQLATSKTQNAATQNKQAQTQTQSSQLFIAHLQSVAILNWL
jgi:hypothetical protein